VVRIVKGDDRASGRHDRVYVGGMQKPQYEAVKELNPQIWLFRYKTGYNPNVGPNPQSHLDRTRGYVHPSDTSLVIVTGRNYSGGSHNTRLGGQAPSRASEWSVTGPLLYEAIFLPELWFLTTGNSLHSYPIQPIATATGDEHLLIGKSGQSGQNTGARPTKEWPAFCDSGRTKGVQSQWFAFAFTIQDTTDPRNRLVGPLSEPVNAKIWPKIKVNYGTCLPRFDRGRKIRITQ
jgi:hypothetical protein